MTKLPVLELNHSITSLSRVKGIAEVQYCNNDNDSLWNLIRAPGHVSEITFKVCCNLYETAAVVLCSPDNFANAR